MPSFFDRVRDAANDLGQQAQRGIDQGQAKLDEGRVRRESDDLAKQLGYLVHRARIEGTEPDQAEVERLSAQLAAREDELDKIKARAAAAPPQQQGGWNQQQGGWGQTQQQPAPQWGQPTPGPAQGDSSAQAPAWGPPGPGTPPAAPPPPGPGESSASAPAWGPPSEDVEAPVQPGDQPGQAQPSAWGTPLTDTPPPTQEKPEPEDLPEAPSWGSSPPGGEPPRDRG
jgi:hypothetical protein